MGKKSKNKKEKLIEYYTIEEKNIQCQHIKKQLQDFGLEIYTEEVKQLDDIMDKYIKNSEEYIGQIKLPGAKRIMDIRFRNNKKWDILLNLKYDENV